mmetsp:Transcript_7920/g.20529  ORF Transcript_7920/g.20529 Transcript_7920/m.20529 type:complete len:80 (+) Transcript_7920:35-274(+)
MGGIPDPVVSGTWTFIGIAVALSVVTIFGRCIGMVSKDTSSISLVLYWLAAFCTWLIWVCAWMHQWHPLIVPKYPGGDD